jgi:hypothetical protein
MSEQDEDLTRVVGFPVLPAWEHKGSTKCLTDYAKTE